MGIKTCIFCQGTLERSSDEHVLPQWLLGYLKIRGEDISPTHYSFQSGSTVVSTRRHKVDNLVEGRVCSKCNNGWMSSLESEAKPLLVPLMEAEKEVVALKPDERLKVARWAFKTALVLNSASNFHKNVPPAHFYHLYNTQESLPPSIAVIGQQHHGDSPFYWLQMSFVLTSDQAADLSMEEAKALVATSYKISFQLKKLLIVVAWWPHPGWRYVIWRGIHVPLWPPKGPVDYYQNDPVSDGFPWEDSLAALTTLHLTFSVSRKNGS